MKNHYFAMKALSACLFFLLLSTANVFSQVGIGTVAPETSSMLDVSSTTKGMLTPRMTTAQRLAIAAPVDGLMAYDIDLKAFHYYNSSTAIWTVMNSAATGRLKFKRIRSTDVLATVLASELAAGGNTKYLLDSGTYYEINGIVTFNHPIDLNNAYLAGQDTNEDVIAKSGNLFEGSTGGSIRNVTLNVTGGAVFNISGVATQNLIFRDSVVRNCANVGTISGLGLVFVSIVQFVGNINGITYNNINQLLLSNVGWFGNNQGTYEKLTGTFGLVQKQGGFSQVEGTAIGFDVAANPVINGDAVMETVVFTGTLSTGGKYVNGYIVGTYSGYNFNNKWNVRCAGIPTETDLTATGDINFDYTVPTAVTTVLTTTAAKLEGGTTSDQLFRFSKIDNNRIAYLGSKKRFFRVGGSISFQTTADNTNFVFYIAKNGVIINKSKVFVRSNSTVDVLALPIQTILELLTNDYIEIFAARVNGTGDVKIASINLSAN